MIRLREAYDWIAVGDDLGSLVGALMVSRLGQSVLVVPLLEEKSSFKSHSGQIWDPNPNWVPGVSNLTRDPETTLGVLGRRDTDSLLLGAILKQSELSREFWSGWMPERSDPWMLTPELRVHLTREDAALAVEATREGLSPEWPVWAEEASRLARTLWAGYPSSLELKPKQTEFRGFKFPFRKMAHSLAPEWKEVQSGSLDEEVRTKFSLSTSTLSSAIWHWVSERPEENPEFTEFMHSFGLSRTGLSYRGGYEQLKQNLMRELTRMGAHVSPQTPCRRIFLEDGKFAGVQLSQVAQMIGAQAGTVMTPLSRIQEMIVQSGSSQVSFRKPADPIGMRLCFSFCVKKNAVPDLVTQKGGLLLWKERGAPPVRIEAVDPADYRVNEPEYRYLFVSVPYLWADHSAAGRTKTAFPLSPLPFEEIRVFSARLFQLLSNIFPGFEANCVRAYPDVRMGVDELKSLYSYSKLEEVPENLRIYSDEDLGSRTDATGLFLVSRESFPKFGAMGPVVAAFEAATVTAQRAGQSGIFTRGAVSASANDDLGVTNSTQPTGKQK